MADDKLDSSILVEQIAATANRYRMFRVAHELGLQLRVEVINDTELHVYGPDDPNYGKPGLMPWDADAVEQAMKDEAEWLQNRVGELINP